MRTDDVTAGQLAYEEDVRRRPTYHDGAPRRLWAELPPYTQGTWERNPTTREWKA